MIKNITNLMKEAGFDILKASLVYSGSYAFQAAGGLPESDQEWRKLAEGAIKRIEDGKITASEEIKEFTLSLLETAKNREAIWAIEPEIAKQLFYNNRYEGVLDIKNIHALKRKEFFVSKGVEKDQGHSK